MSLAEDLFSVADMQVDPSAPPGFFPEMDTVDTPAFHSSESGLCFPPQRRSNSRSGYRLFARIVDAKSTTSRMPSRETLVSYFQSFGQVVDCYLPESATNVAFLCYEDSVGLELCLSWIEHVLSLADGEQLVIGVSRASPRPDYSVHTDRIFVKGLASAFVHRNDLKIYFSRFGEVTDVYIPKDKASGQQKRFAFVTFKELRMARAVLAHLDAHVLADGSLLQVMPAEARPSSGLSPAPTVASSDDGDQSLHELLAVALSLLTEEASF